MRAEQIRPLLLEVIGAVAPERDARSIAGDRPLGEQLALDSLDWLNVSDLLQQRLGVEQPGGLSPSWTLDALAEALARLPPARREGTQDSAGLPQAQYLVKGTWVTLRPLQPEDSELEAALVRRLSDETRYKRFMVTMKELPPGKLHDLTAVDQRRHVALAALAQADDGPMLVGVARYVVDPACIGCEFAVTVDDAWHGCGLAGILMHALIEVARSRGLHEMVGLVLRANEPMLRLARQLGFESLRDPDDRETVRVRLPLQGPSPARAIADPPAP
jgi:GNAT superfamily N-acetyltransferase